MQLDLGETFYFYRDVPAVDNGASRGAIGQSTQTGVVAFSTTHWSVVLAAQGESTEADAALEKLCRTYWWPLYGFVRRQGYKSEEAQDLTQGFFALLLERRDLNTVRKEKGRLRSYLLASLKHFLADEWRRTMTVKRGKGQWLIPLEELRERERIDVERSDRLTADQIYERRWALTVLEQVLARLRDEYRSAGNLRFFDRMKKMLMDEPGRPSHRLHCTHESCGAFSSRNRRAATRARRFSLPRRRQRREGVRVVGRGNGDRAWRFCARDGRARSADW
jgi:DNA-directed RNA polymerase specialized sigma24 family protein